MDLVFYTKEQVAELLHVSVRTVERALKSGELRAVRLGRTVRFSSAEVQRLAEGRL